MNDKWSQFNPHLRTILEEMCRRVCTVPAEIDWNSSEWYLLRSWTEKEQLSFTEWLEHHFIRNKEARLTLTTCIGKDRKCCKKASHEFVWNYGWRSS